jgi:hydroxymethylpyrimidine pyrophosphatase-like HAD family hydrolase
LADITNEGGPKPLKFKVNKMAYTIQSPSTLTESNIPLVTNESIQLLPRVGIYFSINTAHATPDLLKIYQEIQQKDRRGMYLASITGARELFDKLISLNKITFLDENAATKYYVFKFNRFIKFPMVDFGMNVLLFLICL